MVYTIGQSIFPEITQFCCRAEFCGRSLCKREKAVADDCFLSVFVVYYL